MLCAHTTAWLTNPLMLLWNGTQRSVLDETVNSNHCSHWLYMCKTLAMASWHSFMDTKQNWLPFKARPRKRLLIVTASSGNAKQLWNWDQTAAAGLTPNKLTCDSCKMAYFWRKQFDYTVTSSRRCAWSHLQIQCTTLIHAGHLGTDFHRGSCKAKSGIVLG